MRFSSGISRPAAARPTPAGPAGLAPAMLVAFVVGVLPVAGALAGVDTRALNWRACSLEQGLHRLKGEFLDMSVVEDREYVGAVLQNAAGEYLFTQGSGQPGQDRVSFRILRPVGFELVAFWHTHGGSGWARSVFSPTDAELVRQTGLPFYLITPQGEVRVLRPEDLVGRLPRIRGRASRAFLPRGSHRGSRVPALAGVMDV